MRIDVFSHFLPVELRRQALALLPQPAPDLEHWQRRRTLFDAGARVRLLDDAGIDLQVLTTPSPPLESCFDPGTARRLARLANDGMAAAVADHPRRFRGVATVPLLDVDWAVEELRRAVGELGLVGALLYSNVAGRPLDTPALDRFYAAAQALDVPLWLHPERPASQPDYPGEDGSRYGVYLVFGWPYETTVAMARLVFGGVLRRHPGLKVIVHHAGAMLPFFAGRVALQYPEGERLARIGTIPGDGEPVLDQFRRFYVDSVTWGSVPALRTAYELFGAERMLFGTDVPFGPEAGARFARVHVEALEQAELPGGDAERIWSGNARQLLGLDRATRSTRMLRQP